MMGNFLLLPGLSRLLLSATKLNPPSSEMLESLPQAGLRMLFQDQIIHSPCRLFKMSK